MASGVENSSTTSVSLLDAPALDYRWVHSGSKILELPIAPITSKDILPYQPFSDDENSRLESAWKAIPDGKRQSIVAHWGREDGEWAQKAKPKKKETRNDLKDLKKASSKSGTPAGSLPDTPITSDVESPEVIDKGDQYRSIIEQAQNDPSRLDTVSGVSVAQDSLFEVDLDTLSLAPVFWPQSGPRVPVMRGTWFMANETKPCTWDLAREIEKGFQQVKPWLPEYQKSLEAALTLGPTGEEKIKYPLPKSFGHGLAVVFEDESKCRVITSNAFDYLSRYVWSSFGSQPAGTYIYRGYSAAKKGGKRTPPPKSPQSGKPADEKATEVSLTGGSKPPEAEPQVKSDKAPTDKKEKDKATLHEILMRVKQEVDKKKKTIDEANVPIAHTRYDDEPCTDLILVIHGIGQHLAAQYESFSFIYASNQLRQQLRRQAVNPAIASIIRNRRCQILPVQWRAGLDLDTDTPGEQAEFERNNVFTISDITINNSIPYVREVTNSVLLDIPLFMSDHKKQMTAAVCQQANKLYRLWVARHPDFEKHGRVHIIGHSLGSALAAEILSNQPTIIPASVEMPKLDDAKERFIFNTHNCFLAGSPLGVFLKLRRDHLIARGGRARTMDVSRDEAHSHPGKFGCMAVDSLYNIFYTTDPVAYALNATIDVAVSKERPPLAIPSVTKSNFPSLPPLPSMPTMPSFPTMPDVSKYLPSYFGGAPGTGGKPAEESPTAEIELTGEPPRTSLSRGERRFDALNPRGSVDFSLPTSSVNDYVDSVTAHGNYWSDPSFAAFILGETFASASDEVRTEVPGAEAAKAAAGS